MLVKAHNEAPSWQTKRQILSLFANDFSRSELQKLIPGLSKWRIDQARDHATKIGRGQTVPEKKIFRRRIDNAKVDHFLDYISRPQLLQDVAFGTKTLRLDSGEKIIIPAVVRTLIPSRIIEQYVCHSRQQGFEPAGERSLYRILDACSASVQQSLQGLDNITAEGTDAIDNLIKVLETLVENGGGEDWGATTASRIKEVKRYFKTDYKTHTSREEHCADHCTTYALSDPKNKVLTNICKHKHDVECERCGSLEYLFKEIKEKIDDLSLDEEQRNRISFEYSYCEAAICAWKTHLLRTVLQEEAKQDALNKLDEETCLIIVDWAMKFLPLKYRESMCEFFGKRGRSWHVSAVVTRRDDSLEVECFVHVFNSCTQNNYAVASIFEHLFQTLRVEYPQIKKTFLQSDNAACYHNGPLLLCLAEIGKRTGIKVIRYDFSEPQAGKDICDRKTAPMKAHIRRFVNEKNDVVTAEDMKRAIESYGGLRGCRVAVVEVDSAKDLHDNNKIPEISLLYNFKFEEKGIRTWKAYNIGKGNLMTNKDLEVLPQQITSLRVVEPFGPCQKESGVIRATVSTQSDIFPCHESSCVLTFKSEQQAEDHMDTGKHVTQLESVSLYNSIQKKWAQRLTGISAVVVPAPTAAAQQDPTANENPIGQRKSERRKMGWALKTTKKRPRLGDKVKAYLIKKYESGERSGNKADPLSVSKEMRHKKDEDGNLIFGISEWKTAQQIKSFFSRYSAKLKQQQVAATEESDTCDEQGTLDEADMEAWVSETAFQDLRHTVYKQVNTPEHPIVVDQINICELVQNGKIKSLKLNKLRGICNASGLKIKGSQARKKSFLDPLEEIVKSCTCHN